MKIALCTLAAGKDRIYFDSVKRYYPYNKQYFIADRDVDFLLFTDRNEIIDGVKNLPCLTSIWPYCTMLKNNIIGDYFDKNGGWEKYDYVFFIDADFAIGDPYDFFSHEFVFINASWGHNLAAGLFYGGKTKYFRELYELYKEELQTIYERKLSVPHNLDEFYLSMFRDRHKGEFHLIDMTYDNTLAFYDGHNLEEKIAANPPKTFLHPYKSNRRANTVNVKHPSWEKETVINLEEQYIFVTGNNDIGMLIRLDSKHYRILWNKHPEVREVLNIETMTVEVD